jgi:hypothetical protein
MHDEFDKLIDGALSSYSTAEPLAGLEQRVLDRVRATEASRRRRLWWAALALATPALAAILFFAPVRKPDPIPIATVTPQPSARVEPAPPPPSAAPKRALAKPRRAPARVLPKREVFPTLSPLTPEERLLVQLAESRPQMLLTRPVGDIEIKPIEIAPLHIDGNR